LKRVGERKAYFNDIKIPLQLDMEKIIKRTKINSIYELRGFIKHSGNENSGHNFAFCKNMFDDKWYEYNDSCCIPIEGKPTFDKIFLLCYVKVGSDIQNVHYLKEIADSLNENNLLRHFKKY
jgi:ubiquitin C-terminal hydrolase